MEELKSRAKSNVLCWRWLTLLHRYKCRLLHGVKLFSRIRDTFLSLAVSPDDKEKPLHIAIKQKIEEMMTTDGKYVTLQKLFISFPFPIESCRWSS